MTKGAGVTSTVAAARPPRRAHWEHLERGAAIGVRGLAATKPAAFEQAALALTAVIAEPSAIEPRETVEIVCEAADDEALLVAWLNALISLMNERGMLFSRFHVELRPRQLVGAASGERVCAQRHQPVVHVTRATDREVHVGRTRTGEWVAQSVIDSQPGALQ